MPAPVQHYYDYFAGAYPVNSVPDEQVNPINSWIGLLPKRRVLPPTQGLERRMKGNSMPIMPIRA
jgi:hypothetical protein